MKTSDYDDAYVKLKFIEDNLEPARITELIDIEPTVSGRKGEYIKTRKLPLNVGTWYYKYPIAPDVWSVGDAIENLLPLLESKPGLIQYCIENNICIEFSIIMYLARQVPASFFSATLMKRIVAVHADIDFDIYLMFH